MKKVMISVLLVLIIATASYAAYNVKVSAASRYKFAEGGFEADIVTPRVTGMASKIAQTELNREFAEDARELIEEFKEDVAETKRDMPGETVHIGVKSDFVIKTNNKNILAFSVYVLETSGSSSPELDFFNIDKRNGKLIELRSLFKKHSNYVAVLSKYIRSEMDRINKTNPTTFWKEGDGVDVFKEIDDDHDFYINDKGLIVICFDKYDVGPGSSGSPEFVIPSGVIKKIAAQY
ncbi:MAG: RsiV family protein [Synergistaceae bacterium]